MTQAGLARTEGWAPGTFLRGAPILDDQGNTVERGKVRYVTAIGLGAVLVRDLSVLPDGTANDQWGAEVCGDFTAREWTRINLCEECHHCVTLTTSVRLWPDSIMHGMLICSQCGCKRCPHATDHRLTCTRSNAPGQPGSLYGPPEELTTPAYLEGLAP